MLKSLLIKRVSNRATVTTVRHAIALQGVAVLALCMERGDSE